MDSSGNHSAEDASTERGDGPREPEMTKERETKEDGRYIIFYSFEDEDA